MVPCNLNGPLNFHDSSEMHHTGHHHHTGHLLDEYSDEGCQPVPQESTVTTTGLRIAPNGPRKAVILKRVSQTTDKSEDEADIFGKLTAKKLRKLSEEKRDYMMIQINQLFYDQRQKRPCQPKRKMVNRSTSMPPPIQVEKRRVYRMDDFPNLFPNTANVETLSGTAIPVVASLPVSFAAPANEPKPPLIEPEPAVQEDTPLRTPTPVVAPPAEPIVEIPMENTEHAGHYCGIM